MTYRSSSTHAPMRGLGAPLPLLDPAAIGYLMKAVVNAGGCTPAFQANLKAQGCLNTQAVQWLGSCYLGKTPPGVNDWEFAAACLALGKCGGFDMMGCPGDADAMMAQVPSCLTPEMAGEFSPIVDYCRANPTFQGPNKTFNAACWSMSRYPTLFQKVMNTPLCAAAMPPPVTAPATNTTPPLDTTSQVTYDSYAPDSSATTVLTNDTVVPGSDCGSRGPHFAIDLSTGECVEHKLAMSPATMAMFGVGGILALGLGYMLLKKK